MVLSGAVLLSLGLITIWLELKNKWEWRKEYRRLTRIRDAVAERR
jgi:hypothetical protein